jgi:transposase-like protein
MQDWRELLLDLKRRGLAVRPELAIADSALGFWKAAGEVWPTTRAQRCWVHYADVGIRCTRPATPSSACRVICMRRSARRCVKPGRSRAEQLMKNLARRQEREAPGVAASIREGLDEILMVTRLGLPRQLRRSLACTHIIENMNGTIRRVCGNVKRWRDASMALRWTAAGMIEAAKGFPRLKAWKQLPILRAALTAVQDRHALEHNRKAA